MNNKISALRWPITFFLTLFVGTTSLTLLPNNAFSWGEGKLLRAMKERREERQGSRTSGMKNSSEVGLGGADKRWNVPWIDQAGEVGPGGYGRKFSFQGMERFYQFYVPKNYKKGEPTPVVLLFHGGGGYPGSIRYEAQMEPYADRENFIIVYPAGTSEHGFTDRLLTWNDGRANNEGKKSNVDDVGYVNALLDDLPKYVDVDTNRVYAAGFSNGSQFTNRLGQQLSDRIAAIASVAGHRAADDLFSPPPRPISKIQFSGVQDKLGPYEGGAPPEKIGNVKVAFETNLKSVKETIQSWAKHDQCPTKPAETKRVGKAVLERYGPCAEDTEVVLWTLEDGGHTWPGGNMMPASKKNGLGNINHDINASELMLEFFKKHPMK